MHTQTLHCYVWLCTVLNLIDPCDRLITILWSHLNYLLAYGNPYAAFQWKCQFVWPTSKQWLCCLGQNESLLCCCRITVGIPSARVRVAPFRRDARKLCFLASMHVQFLADSDTALCAYVKNMRWRLFVNKYCCDDIIARNVLPIQSFFHFHVRHYFVRVFFCCHLLQGNKM